MKGMLAALMGLMLATAAAAEEFPWRPTHAARPMPVTLGRPVPVTLGRPVPLTEAELKSPPRIDPRVVRAAYGLPAGAPIPVDPQADLPLLPSYPPVAIPMEPPVPMRKPVPAGEPIYTLPTRTRPMPFVVPSPVPPRPGWPVQPSVVMPPREALPEELAPTPVWPEAAPLPVGAAEPEALPARPTEVAPLPNRVAPATPPPSVDAGPIPARPAETAPPARMEGAPAAPFGTDPWPDQDEFYTCYIESIGPGSPARFRVDAEFLTWWLQDAPLAAPLVTAGTPASLGILDRPGTSGLFGGSGLSYAAAPGMRLTIGGWLDTNHVWGLEASGFWIGQTATRFATASSADGAPVLARPVQNVLTGLQTATPISFPGAMAGTAEVVATAFLWGADSNVRVGLFGGSALQADLLLGYRYLDLSEDLTINQDGQLLGGGTSAFQGSVIRAPAVLSLKDSFQTRNQFNGGQVGLRTALALGAFDLEMLTKVALGSTYQVVDITGHSAVLVPGRFTAVAPGGVLALPGNSGRFHDNAFAVVPEVGVTLGYQVNANLRLLVGYNFLYWSSVVRPGDQVSTLVNPTQVPTSLRYGALVGLGQPAPTFQTRDFWAQGITLGLVLRY